MRQEERQKRDILYGRLKSRDYARILEDAREARLSRLEIEAEAARKGSKLADILEVGGIYWWEFYDLPLAQHLALFCVFMGWVERIKSIARSENPQAEILDFAHEEVDDEQNPYVNADKEKQALMFNLLLGVTYSMEAVGYYGLSINELLTKARNGDSVAFRNAVSIDRAVIASRTGGNMIAEAQLRRDKAFLSGLFKRIKNPDARRRQYVDLRLLHRMFQDTGALVDNSREQLLDLVQQLDLYTGKRGDALKGFSELMRNWSRESTI